MDTYQIIIETCPEGKEDIENGLIQLQDDSDGLGIWIVSWNVAYELPSGLKVGK